MIKLKLSFGADDSDKIFEIEDKELLAAAVERALKDVPMGKFEAHESFNILVNGHIIEKEFWDVVKLRDQDEVLISPKIKGGESGQLFKQALIITATVAASVLFGPGGALATGGLFSAAFAVAAVSITASLLLNSLIPPLTPNLGASGSGGGVKDSQMYAFSGQSNQMTRLGQVPKVYGIHRMFPNVAAVPYTELAVDPTTGETIQYLYAIYDFGLGTMAITDIKIGDTPLTTDSFTDFNYQLVDPAKQQNIDEFDEPLATTFKYYRAKRIVTPLSVSLKDGDEVVQDTDDNANGDPQEIVMDFVCPRGLFSFSSQGVTGTRSIKMQIQFALVGTTDWKDYNDINFVDTYSSIGGTDVTNFQVSLDHSDLTYYQLSDYPNGSFNQDKNVVGSYYIKPNSKDLLVTTNSAYDIGAKVFYGNRYLGAIQSVTNLGGGHTKLTLDQVITKIADIRAFERLGYKTKSGSPVFTDPIDVRKLTVTRHEAGIALMTGDKQTPVYGQFKFTPKAAGQFKVKLKRVSTTGQFTTQTADDITWGALTTAYLTPPVATTKRHVFLELKIKATNQLNGNIQNISAVVSAAIPVYDPITQTWTRSISNNPAWVFCDLLTGEVNKKAVDVSRLHLDSIVEWADYCDEIPTPPPDATYLEPRFQSNFILDFQSTLQGILGQVGSAAQASLNIIDGKYGVLIDKFKSTPVQIFTPRNSSGFMSTRVYGPRPDGVKVQFIDPNLDWQISESVVYDNGFNKSNAVNLDQMTAFACTNQEQAWRFGRYMIAQNKLRQENISLLVDFENLVCTRGDYVQITQDVMRVGGTPARVKDVAANVVTIDDDLDIDPLLSYGYTYRSATGDINTSTLTVLTDNSFQLDGDIPSIGDLIIVGEVGKNVYDCIVKSISPNDDLSANLVLIEKADDIFDYESTDVLPDYDPQISNTSAPDFKPPLAVTDLMATDNTWECSATKSGYSYFVELTWNIPPGSVYEFFEIWVNDGRGYTLFDKTTNKIFRYDVSQDRLDLEHGFKVVAVSASGKKLQLIQMPEVLVTPETKSTPPSDVANLDMSITNQVLQLSWDSISDCDAFQYILRFSPETNDNWESSIPLATLSKNVTSLSVQARTGVYFIKAVDFAGNQSANPTAGITTIPNLFDLNVVEELNDAPTFGGTLDQTELLGEAIILDAAVPGDATSIQYYSDGFYTSENVLDLEDVYTVRLQSLIRADGYKFGELMSDWAELDLVDHLNTATSDDWNVAVQYRATEAFAAMSDWASLNVIDHINYGAGIGFTDWRQIPTVGDATGRIFQFRIQLKSLTPNVTPRLFDGTISVDVPDRIDSFENQTSSASDPTLITYADEFMGPGTTPNVQISVDNGQTGDYWSFDSKTLAGLSIRFYDKTGTQVSRQFDLVAKGFGHRHTSTI